MSSPEDIPEDRELSYPCTKCSKELRNGNITKDKDSGHWICDLCKYDYIANRELTILTEDSKWKKS